MPRRVAHGVDDPLVLHARPDDLLVDHLFAGLLESGRSLGEELARENRDEEQEAMTSSLIFMEFTDLRAVGSGSWVLGLGSLGLGILDRLQPETQGPSPKTIPYPQSPLSGIIVICSIKISKNGLRKIFYRRCNRRGNISAANGTPW